MEGKPGTPKYVKARDAFFANRLDRRPRKVEPPAAPPPPPPTPAEAMGIRRGR